ncbi:MAG: cytochrome c [Desulfobacterales bacterium]|nr:MAG: cytochrome c [Desulfobacterales bacterium]
MKKIISFIIVVGVVLFVAYEALMYYDNNFRYGRMRETPAVRPHEDPLLIMEKGIVPVSGGEAVYRATAGDNLTSPLDPAEPFVITRGKTVYLTFCAQCHGYAYDGNGTVGQSFQPLPADLRSPQVQSKSEGELFQSISYGIPGGRQPALHTTISIDDRWHVIAFVKSLGNR